MSDVFAPQPVRTLTPGDVQVKLVDATTSSQAAKVDASGNQYVMITNTSAAPVPIQGGNSSAVVTSDLADGSVTAGTAGTKSMLAGVIYNSSLPTLASGQQAAVQADSSGRLMVVSPTAGNFNATVTQGTSPWVENLSQVGGSALALGQTTMSASIPVTIASNQSALAVSGTVAVTQSTSPWVTKDLADGSSTGGTAGTFSLLAGGIYNSTQPTLTTGQQASLQLDAAGNLRVTLASEVGTINTSDAADGPVTPGSVATKSILGGVQYNSTLPTLTTGQQAAVQADSSGRLLVSSIANALPAGTNLLGGATVYVGSTVASASNPLPVTITDTVPGTAVNSYHTTASLAAAGVANHVYTITTSKTFNGKFFTASGSGKIRADVQTSPDGSTYTTYFTQISSPSNPNVQIPLDLLTLSDSGSGSTIRIQITNEDLLTFDVFSTICGVEN